LARIDLLDDNERQWTKLESRVKTDDKGVPVRNQNNIIIIFSLSVFFFFSLKFRVYQDLHWTERRTSAICDWRNAVSCAPSRRCCLVQVIRDSTLKSVSRVKKRQKKNVFCFHARGLVVFRRRCWPDDDD
jgi:hypothetical protein